MSANSGRPSGPVSDRARPSALASSRWFKRIVTAGTFLTVGAVTLAGVAPSAGAASAISDVTSAERPGEVGEPNIGDDSEPGDQSEDVWSEPEPSVTQDPAVVARGVGRNESVRVSSVVNRDGVPQVVVQDVAGTRAAKRQIAKAQDVPGVVAVEVDTKVGIESTNDPKYSELWALPVLEAEKAWSVSRGSGIVVAVLDTGIDGSHPDLLGALVNGVNNVDEDSSPPTTDGNGHGTHVAGTIAARANNRTGIAGLAPRSKVMPVKVLDSSGSGYSADVAQGVIWAVDHGADVLNLSLGGGHSSVIKTAVNYALSEGRTVVAAAGNGGANSSGYPAAYPGVISVSALNRPGTSLAGYSNRGENVDLAAPGSAILSTVPGGGYSFYSGTSMAAPHVAAAAALVLAVNPRGDVESILNRTAHDLGASGYDSTYANGRLDAAAAVGVKVAVVKKRQRVKVPKVVKVAKTKRLRNKSRQGIKIKKWVSKKKRICSVKKRGGKWRVRGLAKGRCSVKIVVPGNNKYRRTVVKMRIRVK